MSSRKTNIGSFVQTALTVIGTLLTFVAIISAYDIYNRSKPVKELQITLDSSVPIVDVRPEAIQDIEILYRGEKVPNMFLVQLTIKNTGNQPIIESDYSKNLSFSLNSDIKIVEVSKISSEPSNIEVLFSFPQQNQVEISPFLLNSGDVVTLRLAAIGTSTSSLNMQVDGRIVGVKQLKIINALEKLDLQIAQVRGSVNVMVCAPLLTSFTLLILLAWIQWQRRSRSSDATDSSNKQVGVDGNQRPPTSEV